MTAPEAAAILDAPSRREGGPSGTVERAMPFSGVKVFSATKAKEREELGETVTRWLQSNPGEALLPVRRKLPAIRR